MLRKEMDDSLEKIRITLLVKQIKLKEGKS